MSNVLSPEGTKSSAQGIALGLRRQSASGPGTSEVLPGPYLARNRCQRMISSFQDFVRLGQHDRWGATEITVDKVIVFRRAMYSVLKSLNGTWIGLK